jgi:hypothetical protein
MMTEKINLYTFGHSLLKRIFNVHETRIRNLYGQLMKEIDNSPNLAYWKNNIEICLKIITLISCENPFESLGS